MTAGAKESCVIMEDISPVLIDIIPVSRHTWQTHRDPVCIGVAVVCSVTLLVFRSINFEWMDQFQSKFTEG